MFGVIGINGGEGQEGEVEGVTLVVDEVAELAGGERLGFALELGAVADGVIEENMVSAAVDMVEVLDVAGRGVDGFVEGDGGAVVVGGADASQEVADGGDGGIGALEVAGVKGTYGDGAANVGAGNGEVAGADLEVMGPGAAGMMGRGR